MPRPSPAARALALALPALALPGALWAHATGWSSREALDPFDGIVLTIASAPSEYLDSRLQVECRDDGVSRRVRVRIVTTGAPGTSDALDAGAVTEVLVRVDASPTRSFGAEALSVAADEGGGTVIGDRSGGEARAAALVADLAAGSRVWTKLRTAGRDRLFSYDLTGARSAIEVPLEACGASVEGVRDARAGTAAGAGAMEADRGAEGSDSGSGTGSGVGARTSGAPLEGVRADVRVELSAAERSAASAALPNGLDMGGLVGRLDGALDRAGTALEGVARGADPGSALPEVRAAADELGRFQGVFRRLPDAAASPLSRIAAARAGRVRDLADAALAEPGAGATLAPAIGSLLESLERVAGR